MRSTTEIPYEPAALAGAVRALARDAYLALKGPSSDVSLADLVDRAARLRSCLEDHATAPLGPWLENLARVLEDARTEVVRRETSHLGRVPHEAPPSAGWRIHPAFAGV